MSHLQPQGGGGDYRNRERIGLRLDVARTRDGRDNEKTNAKREFCRDMRCGGLFLVADEDSCFEEIGF